MACLQVKAGFWAWYASKIKRFPRWLLGKLRGLRLDPLDEGAIGLGGISIGAIGGFYLLVSGEFLFGVSFLLSAPFWVTVHFHGKWREAKIT